MTVWRQRIAVFFLLLLPLQGWAATLSAFTCFSVDAHQTQAVGSQHHDTASTHEHDGDTGKDHSGHLNCHHFFSGMPAAVSGTESPELPAFESSISLLFTLFVPEQPQRPPRI